MGTISIAAFADRLGETMPAIMREFVKHQAEEFCLLKVTMPQFVILEFLYKKGPARMSAIASYIHVTTAATTGLVDRLVRDGYLVRNPDPGDRRVVNVRLTPRGQKTVANILKKRKQMIIKMFAVVSPQERAEYLRILTRIHEHIA